MKNEALKVRVAQAVVARCEPHGQIVRAARADREKTNKRRTKDEQRTNKERTKNEQRTNKERTKNEQKTNKRRTMNEQ